MDNKPIYNLRPHYTNHEFIGGAKTVWIESGYHTAKGGIVQGLQQYEYSDRIWQWNREKASKAVDVIDPSLDRNSPAFIQELLRYFYDNPDIVLVHVMAGVNHSNGYDYQIYGFADSSAKLPPRGESTAICDGCGHALPISKFCEECDECIMCCVCSSDEEDNWNFGYNKNRGL